MNKTPVMSCGQGPARSLSTISTTLFLQPVPFSVTENVPFFFHLFFFSVFFHVCLILLILFAHRVTVESALWFNASVTWAFDWVFVFIKRNQHISSSILPGYMGKDLSCDNHPLAKRLSAACTVHRFHTRYRPGYIPCTLPWQLLRVL